MADGSGQSAHAGRSDFAPGRTIPHPAIRKPDTPLGPGEWSRRARSIPTDHRENTAIGTEPGESAPNGAARAHRCLGGRLRSGLRGDLAQVEAGPVPLDGSLDGAGGVAEGVGARGRRYASPRSSSICFCSSKDRTFVRVPGRSSTLSNAIDFFCHCHWYHRLTSSAIWVEISTM